jgi:hypothetical protein
MARAVLGSTRLDPRPTPSLASSRPPSARRTPRGRAERPIVYERTPGAASRPLPSSPPAASPASATSLGTYQRRQPERTLLYRVVARELDALDQWLADRSPYGHGLPAHVRRELEGFLDCGLLGRGFTRVVCRQCRFEHLVAFSCRSRGACPSCAARRMDDTAAHLVDRTLPWADYRQWVVTFTPRVRWHLAADPKLASGAITTVVRTLSAWQRTKARQRGVKLPRNTSRVGAAVVFVQRFDSARPRPSRRPPAPGPD